MAYPSIATEDTSQADENGCSMITADVQNRSSLMVSVLTCSFLQPDLCAQFSPLLGIPCPWKFASTCQASVLAHVRPVGQHVSHTNYHCEMRLSRLKLIWCVAL